MAYWCQFVLLIMFTRNTCVPANAVKIGVGEIMCVMV